MEKVLVVSYHFPPSGGAKTRRLLKFLKYLPQFGWMPIVLTTKGGMGFGFDPSLLEIIPREVRVHRTFDLLSFFKRILTSCERNRFKRFNPETGNGNRLKKSAVRLFRGVLSWTKKWTAIPDVFMLVWAPFAISTGFRAIAREATAVIYSTGPPFSNHVIGLCLKRLTKKPLIVDFRDAWTANPVRRTKYPVARHPIELLLEKCVIRNADLVVCTTEGITQDFCQRYSGESAVKFLTLPNGYDREEFCVPGKRERDKREKMLIVHTGHLRLERSPKPLLMALRRLFDEQPHLADDLEVYLIGENQPFLDGKNISDYLREFGLQSVVKLIDHVPQSEAIRYQMSADILLLIIGVVPAKEVATYGVASKVFDYMLAGRPVLTLADPGPVSELVRKTQIGPAFALSDIEGIKRYLLDALKAFKCGRLETKSNKIEIDRYDFRQLTGELSKQFDALKPH